MKNRGFTLIELVVVIVILGILAVIAAPRFLDLQQDAKIADVKGVAGAVASAAELAYSQSAIEGKEREAEASLDIGLEYNALVQYGYPRVSRQGMEYFLDMSSSYHNEDNKEWTWGADNPQNGKHFWVVTLTSVLGNGPYTREAIIASNCYVKYNAPVNESEGYSVETFTDGC